MFAFGFPETKIGTAMKFAGVSNKPKPRSARLVRPLAQSEARTAMAAPTSPSVLQNRLSRLIYVNKHSGPRAKTNAHIL